MKIRKPKIHYIKITTKYFQNYNEVRFDDIDPNEYWYKDNYNQIGDLIYWVDSEGYWERKEYYNGNEIYCETSDGYWEKREYDQRDNEIYYEDSNGYWSKSEYNIAGELLRKETSHCGIIYML